VETGGQGVAHGPFPARLDDLKVPPGNRLHELERDRTGQHSISVNDQWRICFRFVDGDAYDVEITDYHAQRAVDLWDAARAIKTQVERIKPLKVA
jgi:hypothetical protein